MFFKKKKPFVRFVNLMPGVEHAHPVIKTQDMKVDWMRHAAMDYKERASNYIPGTGMLSGTNRCAGLLQLFRTGFVITAPIDFTIATNGNLESFQWTAPVNAQFQGHDYIMSHGAGQLAKFIPFRQDTLHTILKINTRWRASCSDDVVFLQMPVPYPEHTSFTAATGIFDFYQSHEINVQLFWHKLNDTVLVKAGTPLCMLVPIPRNFNLDLIVEPATAEDRYKDNAWNYISNKDFNKDIKAFYEASKSIFRFKSK